jgi:hypothetical protein
LVRQPYIHSILPPSSQEAGISQEAVHRHPRYGPGTVGPDWSRSRGYSAGRLHIALCRCHPPARVRVTRPADWRTWGHSLELTQGRLQSCDDNHDGIDGTLFEYVSYCITLLLHVAITRQSLRQVGYCLLSCLRVGIPQPSTSQWAQDRQLCFLFGGRRRG